MEQSPQQPSIELKGSRLLVVDDDRLNLRILAGILRGEGYELTEADSAERALELYAANPPDLVLFDVMLPGINGFDACRLLKKTYGDACAPVIFITAKVQSDDVVEGLTAGGVDYLPKPFKPKEVIARIRTHLQNQLLVEQQKKLVAELSHANSAKNKFLGMAAHDLRNPLASIRGLSEFLRDGAVGELTPDQLDLINTIHGASQSMLDMVNELLDVATIESGELRILPEVGELAAVIEKSVYLRSIDASKKQTTIEFTQGDLNPVASIDSAKMQQVVDNLISNAVKYSPPGSVVRVELHADAKGVGFSVKDQGPGIPENERHRLFKDFSRLSVRPTGGEKSTGLGLAICRKIVEAHHGTIIAQNLPTRGCEFRVTLPPLK